MDDAVIDESRLEELACEVGAADLHEVLTLFVEEAGAEIARIAAVLGDVEHGKAAHFLRSGALNVGFTALAAAAAAARDLAPADRARAVPALSRALDDTRRALAARAPA